MTDYLRLYASVGAQFTHYDVDVDNAALTRRESISVPANAHYAWPHAQGTMSLCGVER